MGRKKINPKTRLRNKNKYDAEYKKKYLRRYTLSLNMNTDSAMISHLDGIEQYSKYIKNLVQKDMEDKK